MDTEGLFAVDPADIPLLVATGMIAVGCLLFITDTGRGHPLVSLLVIGGTIAFVILTLKRIPDRDLPVGVASLSMILGSVLVSVDIRLAFDFDGPIGAAFFLFGAVELAKYIDD